jgi:hypothetical protein
MEVSTWTQRDNHVMRQLNQTLGQARLGTVSEIFVATLSGSAPRVRITR